MRETAKKFTRLFILASTVTLIGCGSGAETKTDPNKVDPSGMEPQNRHLTKLLSIKHRVD